MAISDTEADAAYPEFWLATAIGALRANTVMANLVRRDASSELADEGDIVNVTKRGDVTVRDKTEDTPIQTDSPSNTKVPVAMDTHKYVAWTLEDTSDAKAVDEAVEYVEDAMIGLAEAIDSDLLTLYSDVANDVGEGGQDITDSTILDARKQLNDQKAPMSGRNLVVSSKDDRALLAIDKLSDGSTPEGGQALREAQLGRIYGFDAFMDQNVQTSGSNPTITHNLAFHRNAFYLVSRTLKTSPEGAVSTVMTDPVTGMAFRYTRQYSIDDLATKHVIDVLYGVKSVDENRYAVEVLA
ncbi:MAG: P22 phage major capsid protein family protein [Trueperaceae bacterium]|nr:P22 phage major capsid protein family protein [Trueperaceae bacterium]